MKDKSELTREFVKISEAELVAIAKTIFGPTPEGLRYPTIMTVHTDFGTITILKHGE